MASRMHGVTNPVSRGFEVPRHERKTSAQGTDFCPAPPKGWRWLRGELVPRDWPHPTPKGAPVDPDAVMAVVRRSGDAALALKAIHEQGTVQAATRYGPMGRWVARVMTALGKAEAAE